MALPNLIASWFSTIFDVKLHVLQNSLQKSNRIDIAIDTSKKGANDDPLEERTERVAHTNGAGSAIYNIRALKVYSFLLYMVLRIEVYQSNIMQAELRKKSNNIKLGSISIGGYELALLSQRLVEYLFVRSWL
jgi:hypothetical protein